MYRIQLESIISISFEIYLLSPASDYLRCVQIFKYLVTTTCVFRLISNFVNIIITVISHCSINSLCSSTLQVVLKYCTDNLTINNNSFTYWSNM